MCLQIKPLVMAAIFLPIPLNASPFGTRLDGVEEIVDMPSAVEALQKTVSDISQDFIGHTPYLFTGLVVLLLT